MKLLNLDTGELLANNILVAKTFYTRLKGLMFTKNLPSDCALHIQPCRGIHTFFMHYSIDVLHLDSNHKIVAIEENLQPGKIGNTYPCTVEVVELCAGKVQETKTKIGNRLQFK
ncbi:DUF192 domain-containing protein [Lutibacter sp. B2]|nr:DUF192 domain-containing protein [Lutibacter sp. B2]